MYLILYEKVKFDLDRNLMAEASHMLVLLQLCIHMQKDIPC